MPSEKLDQNSCPCCSGKPYASCCEPYLTGKSVPATAEALMRSRYVAYSQQNNEYILQTWHPSTRPDIPNPAANDNVSWTGLEILRTEDGKENDSKGIVEFRARCRIKDQAGGLDEASEFVKEDGRWFYVDGSSIQPVKTRHLKVGRNDPCSCGSGKKYKQCCGR